MKDEREIFALKNFIDIMRACRRQLVADVLSVNPRYELQWFEAHWLKCKEIFDNTEIPLATRREMLKIFLRWYQKFLEAWGYKSTDAFFFDAEIKSLELLIDTNRSWTAQLDQLQMSFIRETKLIDKEIEEAKNL